MTSLSCFFLFLYLTVCVVILFVMMSRSKKRPGDNFVQHNPTPKNRKTSPDVENIGDAGPIVITDNIVDRNLELTDPTPNIQDLLKSLDAQFFAGLLFKNNVKVKWSASLNLHFDGAAGHCITLYELKKHEKNEGEKLIKIRLNERILKFRTRRDLVETLLHEMIHAYLAINNTCDVHGPNFQKQMDRINAVTGANVTVYHNFDNEIALYENRLWRCNGKCRKRPPQFGLIRMKSHKFHEFKDQWWWSYHSKNCGGNFELVDSGEIVENGHNQEVCGM